METRSNKRDVELATCDVRLSEPVSLIGVISKKINNLTLDTFRKDNVPKGMKLVLQCLINRNGVTQLDIVKFTGFKAPTISIMIQKMEAVGYITRKPDDTDLRAMRVFITDKGISVYENAVKNVKFVEETVLKGISSKELDSLCKTLKKINANL